MCNPKKYMSNKIEVCDNVIVFDVTLKDIPKYEAVVIGVSDNFVKVRKGGRWFGEEELVQKRRVEFISYSEPEFYDV